MFTTANIRITPDILALLSKLDEFKGAWRALGTLAPDRLLALRRVATIESIGSSTRIEGSKLSDRAVEVLLEKIELKSFASRDEQEVAGYAEVMELLFSSWEHIAFNENHTNSFTVTCWCTAPKMSGIVANTRRMKTVLRRSTGRARKSPPSSRRPPHSTPRA